MEGLRPTALLALLALSGCATAQTGVRTAPVATATAPVACDSAVDSQFERGRPHPIIDGVGWVFGIPEKILLWDRRAVNHDVSPRTEQSLAEYMAANGMTSTKVRINEYDPGGEWRRLADNKSVGAGWRYTIGALDTLAYTIFPGRLFGADRYNPYTDSVYVYSDIPAIAQEHAARAKLVHERSRPGTYAALTSLPIVRLWPEKRAKDDVYAYDSYRGSPAEEEEAIRVLYPEYGSEVGGELGLFDPAGLLLTVAGAGVGHIAAHFEVADHHEYAATTPMANLPPADADMKEVAPVSFNQPAP